VFWSFPLTNFTFSYIILSFWVRTCRSIFSLYEHPLRNLRSDSWSVRENEQNCIPTRPNRGPFGPPVVPPPWRKTRARGRRRSLLILIFLLTATWQNLVGFGFLNPGHQMDPRSQIWDPYRVPSLITTRVFFCVDSVFGWPCTRAGLFSPEMLYTPPLLLLIAPPFDLIFSLFQKHFCEL
jgi:hypothetical protein